MAEPETDPGRGLAQELADLPWQEKAILLVLACSLPLAVALGTGFL